MAGHPDDQAYAVWRSGDVLNDASVIAGLGTKNYGTFNTSNFAGMFISVQPGIGFGTVTIKHWSDVAHTTLVDTSFYTAVNGLGLVLVIPAITDAMEIKYDNLLGVNDTVVTVMEQTNLAGNRPSFPQSSPALHQAGIGVAAGTTQFYGPAFICPGLCWFHASSGAAAGLLKTSVVTTLDGNTVNYTITSGDPNVTIDRLIMLGDLPVMVTCQNTSGVLQTHTFSLTPESRW